MNPYEKTAEEMGRQSERPKRLAQSAIGIASAAGAASFAPVLARAAPFLSKYIPENLAIKGLSKISPKLGSFIQKSMSDGFDFNQVKDFIGEQINESQQQEPAKQKGNIIEQYSPELHQFISQEIAGGRKPIEAAAIAQHDKRFSNVISKLSKDHKTPWSSIIESIYGSEQQALPEQFGNPEQLQNPTSQQQQGGQGQQAIMQALQMAAESRKRRQK